MKRLLALDNPIIWKSFKTYLLDHGFTVVPADRFSSDVRNGFILMVDTKQYDIIFSDTFMVESIMPVPLLLTSLEAKEEVITVYRFGRDSHLVLESCTIDDKNRFSIDDFLLIPIAPYEQTD